MLVRLLLNQKTGMSFAVSCFNDGLSSPFFSLLNGDDAVRELVDDIFDAASRQVKLAFVQEHKEGIMQTRHGHSFFRGLYKSGLITEPAADLVTEESAKSEGGPTTERIEK
ncbi:hypothetical protein PFISCL1PPCAC_28667 [Pristionchus fissidentatus]|uniref:Uncharacterized protein n=2 Tax=Pristionchus fissidentatus TaxID=1538716 RepID=A0AAV5X0Z4_9BILA|nr:hypothetical protein PFISCL1PPCAC_28667 [Pristionchus fissidentatus]